jgi:hypothetical protein
MPNPAPRRNRPLSSIATFCASATRTEPPRNTVEADSVSMARCGVYSSAHRLAFRLFCHIDQPARHQQFGNMVRYPVANNGRSDPESRTCCNGVHGEHELRPRSMVCSHPTKDGSYARGDLKRVSYIRESCGVQLYLRPDQ